MSNQINLQGDSDPYVVVKAKLINKSGVSLTLVKEDSFQVKSKRSSEAPVEVASGKTHEFTLSPHDELIYTTGEGEDAHFKIKFDDDDDHPKLKLGKAYEGKGTKLGVQTTKVERKEETETKYEEETSETRTTGDPFPEFKETLETEEEKQSGNTKTETKSKKKTEFKKDGKKTTTVRKTETKKKEVEVTWEIYKV